MTRRWPLAVLCSCSWKWVWSAWRGPSPKFPEPAECDSSSSICSLNSPTCSCFRLMLLSRLVGPQSSQLSPMQGTLSVDTSPSISDAGVEGESDRDRDETCSLAVTSEVVTEGLVLPPKNSLCKLWELPVSTAEEKDCWLSVLFISEGCFALLPSESKPVVICETLSIGLGSAQLPSTPFPSSLDDEGVRPVTGVW